MSEDAGKTSSPKSVVVVEDEESVNQVLVDFLVDRGYQVARALDGRSAMKLIESGEFDGIILDLNLPEMDGRAVLAEMRQHFPDLPAIVLSGYVTERDTELLAKAGANAVFAKPAKLGEVADKLDELTA